MNHACLEMSPKLAGFTWEEFPLWTCASLVVKNACSVGSDKEGKRGGKRQKFTLQQQAQNRLFGIFSKLNTGEQDLLLQSFVLSE